VRRKAYMTHPRLATVGSSIKFSSLTTTDNIAIASGHFLFQALRIYTVTTYGQCHYKDNVVWRMASSGMLCRVVVVRTDISEELSPSFIRVARIGELGTMLAVTSNQRRVHQLLVTASVVPDEGSAKFFQNVGSYMSHTT
jgi:hypothetical protein